MLLELGVLSRTVLSVLFSGKSWEFFVSSKQLYVHLITKQESQDALEIPDEPPCYVRFRTSFGLNLISLISIY